MAICISKYKNGKNCEHKAKYGDYCGIHRTDKNKTREIKECITITFSDVCENNVGMEKIGNLKNNGLTYEELLNAYNSFKNNNVECELICLNDYLKDNEKVNNEDLENTEKAYILIVRNGVDYLLRDIKKDKGDFFKEQKELEWDKEMFSRKHINNGKNGVVNKKARWNLCYSDISQKSDIENKKGTIVNFKDLECTSHIRNKLPLFLGENAKSLNAEGNYYYDIDKCYISMHGDTERKIVIAVRLGESFPLYYQWYYQSNTISDLIKLNLNFGDIYFMSSKAVGHDWKKRNSVTLRHAAGLQSTLKF